MKIVTVNVPESYLDAVEKLVGENGLYPSRSELIRVAVRDYLLKELKQAKKFVQEDNDEVESDENIVKIPEKEKDRSEMNFFDVIDKFDYYGAKIIDVLRNAENPLTPYELSCSISQLSKNRVERKIKELTKKYPRLICKSNGKNRFYTIPSALRKMIIKKGYDPDIILKNEIPDYKPKTQKKEENKDVVRVPVEARGNKTVEFKTYKIIRRLEH